MTDQFDVVVIGGGLAGQMAALAAANRGSDVAIVSRAESTRHRVTGTIGLLGYGTDGSTPLVDPFDGMDGLPPAHPHRRVAERDIREGMALFDGVVGDSYLGDHTDRNGLVPTQFGTANPAARYPASFEPGLLSAESAMLVLGLEGLPGFDGEFIAGHLSERVPYRVRGANLDLLAGTALDQPALRVARALDRNEAWPGEEPIRDRLAEQVTAHHRDEPRVGLPAVLGRDEHEAVRTQLAATVGARIFEIPTTPPSLPGIRLRATLQRALRSNGVEIYEGFEGSSSRDRTFERSRAGAQASETGTEITELRAEDHPSPIRGSQYILATGGLGSGGLEESGGKVIEPIFALPVETPPDRSDWSRSDPFAAQPFARFGLEVDDDLRPLRGSEPAARNLRACGTILGGFDPTVEHSGSGVAIATGVRAGRLAAREVDES